MLKSDWINFKAGEILAWVNSDGVRYAIINRNGKFYDQTGREINSDTLKAAIEAAMK